MKRFSKIQIFWLLILSFFPIVNCKEEPETNNKQIHRSLSLCGQFKGPLRNNSTRIVGGYYAKPGQFPSFVFLTMKRKGYHIVSCGGIILSDELILTAAHCMMDLDDNQIVTDIRIYTGSHRNSDDGFAYTARRVCVSKKFIKYVGHDIAVIKLDTKIWFPEEVQPACLPIRQVKERDIIYAIGKGHDSVPSRSNRPLKVVEVGLTTCNQAVNDQSNFCFFPRDTSKGRSGVCFGDSGGGLYIVENNKMYVVGVASFSWCAETTEGSSGGANLFNLLDEIHDLVKECSLA